MRSCSLDYNSGDIYEARRGRGGEKSLSNLPRKSPTLLQRRKMIGLKLEVGIKAAMQGHMHQLDGKVHLQSEGSPIGLELSGALLPSIPTMQCFALLQCRYPCPYVEK